MPAPLVFRDLVAYSLKAHAAWRNFLFLSGNLGILLNCCGVNARTTAISQKTLDTP